MGKASTAKRARRIVWEPFTRCSDVEIVTEHYEAFANNQYMVLRRVVETAGVPGGKMIHLSIRRMDRGPARDWRHFQRIKNELVGEEAEGVELYPAESRLLDGANQFHLWCIPTEAHARFPFGYEEGRSVMDADDPIAQLVKGGKQRGFGEELP